MQLVLSVDTQPCVRGFRSRFAEAALVRHELFKRRTTEARGKCLAQQLRNPSDARYLDANSRRN